jgi:16S rRNA (cytidine1402-2'-O)-methyltransferase
MARRRRPAPTDSDDHASDDQASPGLHPAGRLVVVGTPIGNLSDMSPRGADALRGADLIACEDTRRTGRLLELLGIPAPRLIRMDAHTESGRGARRRGAGRLGRRVAVASDAGMPGLSDPGARLIEASVSAGVPVEVVPGPFAGVVAAVASGLLDPSGRFVFEGFLPRKGPERRARLAAVASEQTPVVLYESPHRVLATVGDLATACGSERRIALCRELTKMHEEVWRGTLEEAVRHAEHRVPRGEYVLVLEGASPPDPPSDEQLRAALGAELTAGATRRDASIAVAERFGVPANRVKRLGLR